MLASSSVMSTKVFSRIVMYFLFQVVIALTGGEIVYFEMDPVRVHCGTL